MPERPRSVKSRHQQRRSELRSQQKGVSKASLHVIIRRCIDMAVPLSSSDL
jgi:hypothetical protein